MKADKLEQIREYSEAIAELLYEETAAEKVKTLEGIEGAVREHLINYINPEIAKILSIRAAEQQRGEKEK